MNQIQFVKFNQTELGRLIQNSGSNYSTIKIALEAIRACKKESASLTGRIFAEKTEGVSSLFQQIYSSEFTELSREIGYEDPLSGAESLLWQALLNQIEIKPATIFLAELCRQDKGIPNFSEDPIAYTQQVVEDFFAKVGNSDEAVSRGWIQESEIPTWEGRAATWKTNFSTFIHQMKENKERTLFSQDPVIRGKEYRNFATRLLFSLNVLLEKEEVYDFFDRCIPDLLNTCYTRWDQEIFQLQKQAYPDKMKEIQLLIPQFAARDLRRKIFQYEIFPEIVQELREFILEEQELITDVHYIAKLRQCANKEFGLGFTEEELGKPEPLEQFKEIYEEKKQLFASKCSSQRLKLELDAYWQRLSPAEKQLCIDDLVNAYREASLKGELPLTPKAEIIRTLYAKLEGVSSLEGIQYLKDLRREFQEEEVVFPFEIPPISPEEILIEFKNLTGDPKNKRRIDQGIKDLKEGKEILQLISSLGEIFPEHKLLEGLASQDDWKEKSFHDLNRSIESAKDGVERAIAQETANDLRSKLVIGDQLTPFGLSAWAIAGKIATASDPMLCFLSELEDLDTLVIERLKTSPELYFSLSEKGRLSPEIQMMIRENPGLLYGVSKDLYNSWNRNPLLSLKEDPICKNCKGFILKAITINGNALKYASDALKADREVVLRAVSQDGNALQFASPALKADKEVVFQAVSQYGNALAFASPALKADKEVVFKAVSQDGWAFQYASDVLKGDKEIALQAVSQVGRVLDNVSDALKEDKEIVLRAVSQTGLAFQYASDALKADREFVLQAVSQNGYALLYASNALKADREFILQAVSQNGYALFYASDALKADRDVVLRAVSQNGRALQYASDALKADKEVVLQAVSQDGSALEFASDALREDEEVVRQSAKSLMG